MNLLNRRQTRSGRQDPRDSHTAPEPEGPEEIYRRFERLNRRGGGTSLRELASGSGRKALYGAFAVVEVAAIVLGLFLDVPFMDIVAFVLPGLLLMFHGGSKNEEPGESGSEAKPVQESPLDRLRELLGDQHDTESENRRHTGGDA